MKRSSKIGVVAAMSMALVALDAQARSGAERRGRGEGASGRAGASGRRGQGNGERGGRGEGRGTAHAPGQTRRSGAGGPEHRADFRSGHTARPTQSARHSAEGRRMSAAPTHRVRQSEGARHMSAPPVHGGRRRAEVRHISTFPRYNGRGPQRRVVVSRRSGHHVRYERTPGGRRVTIRHIPVRRRVRFERERKMHWVRHRSSGRRYVYDDGGYWVRRGGGWVTVRPPIGLRVAYLPPRRARLYVDGVLHYECDGVIYRQFGGGFEVVAGPDYY